MSQDHRNREQANHALVADSCSHSTLACGYPESRSNTIRSGYITERTVPRARSTTLSKTSAFALLLFKRSSAFVIKIIPDTDAFTGSLCTPDAEAAEFSVSLRGNSSFARELTVIETRV